MMAFHGKLSFPNELSDPRTQPYQITVDGYHQMLQAGIIEEGAPYELLYGLVVRKDRSAAGEDPMTVSREHALGVAALEALQTKLVRLGCHMQNQQPISIPPRHEPEPDGAIIRGKPGDYPDHHPDGADVLCVIEVSDSSLRRDQTTKLRIYAEGHIKQYVIVNLPDRVVEVYSAVDRERLTYSPATIYRPGQSVVFPTARGKGLSVPVRDLLPPAKGAATPKGAK